MARIGIGDAGKKDWHSRELALHLAAPLQDNSFFLPVTFKGFFGYMAKANELKEIPDLLATSLLLRNVHQSLIPLLS